MNEHELDLFSASPEALVKSIYVFVDILIKPLIIKRLVMN